MFSYFGKRKLAKMWQLVCNGKTKHGWFGTPQMLWKPHVWRKKALYLRLYSAHSRDNLSPILFCSIPGGRESESSFSLHQSWFI